MVFLHWRKSWIWSSCFLVFMSLQMLWPNGCYCFWPMRWVHRYRARGVGGARLPACCFVSVKHFSVLCSFAAVISAHPIHSLDNPHRHFHSGSLASPTCSYLHHQASPWPLGPSVSHSDRANSTGEKPTIAKGMWWWEPPGRGVGRTGGVFITSLEISHELLGLRYKESLF